MKNIKQYKVSTFLILDDNEKYFDSKEEAAEYGKKQVKTGKVAFLLERVIDNQFEVIAEIR